MTPNHTHTVLLSSALLHSKRYLYYTRFLLSESAALLSDNTLLDSRQTGGLPLSFLVSSSSPSFAFADDDDDDGGDDDNEDDAEDLGYSD